MEKKCCQLHLPKLTAMAMGEVKIRVKVLGESLEMSDTVYQILV